MSRPITFEDFIPGSVMGSSQQTLDPGAAADWQRIFGAAPEDGADGAAESASLAVVAMMRAYLEVVTPRPPGNVHAQQDFQLHELPRLGETIHTVVRCAGKEMRRERRYVELQVSGSGDQGRPLYTGTMKLIWAA